MNGNALFWQDPDIDDDRPDAVLTAAQTPVGAVAHALADPGFRPAPERIAAVRRPLAFPPLEPERLPGLRMRHGWATRNDTVEPDDLEAPDAPRARAPGREHPGDDDLVMGVIAGRSAGRWDGFGCDGAPCGADDGRARLWIFAVRNKPDGRSTGVRTDWIERVARRRGESGRRLNGRVATGFLAQNADGIGGLHDGERHERATNAAPRAQRLEAGDKPASYKGGNRHARAPE